MEALKMTRAEYTEALQKIEQITNNNETYLDLFEVEFPDGLNTASPLEICRVIQDSSMEAKDHLMRLCIQGKNVKVKCPNGETFSFCLAGANDSMDGFELFRKEPLALLAIQDVIYGHVLKKSLRLSKPKAAAATATE